MTAFALLAASLLLSAQDKTYDLKLDAPRKAGQKFKLVETQHVKMKMLAGGQPAADSDDKKHFEAVEEVVAADGQGNDTLRWTFAKAERMVEGKMAPFGFQGKTVVVKTKGEERTFAYPDGQALAEEDAAGLEDAFDDSGEDDASKAFAPSKPVKAGETWTPDIKAVARLFDEEMAEAVNPSASRATFTLKAVETRDGVEFGRIEGTLELMMGLFGPMRLEKPIPLKLAVEMDVCIDGRTSAGTLKMKGEMKGATDAEADGNKLRIDLDMTLTGTLTRTPVK